MRDSGRETRLTYNRVEHSGLWLRTKVIPACCARGIRAIPCLALHQHPRQQCTGCAVYTHLYLLLYCIPWVNVSHSSILECAVRDCVCLRGLEFPRWSTHGPSSLLPPADTESKDDGICSRTTYFTLSAWSGGGERPSSSCF